MSVERVTEGEAVFLKSEAMPTDSVMVAGLDYDTLAKKTPEQRMLDLVKSYGTTGFQATNVAKAVDSINAMLSWRRPLADDEEEEPRPPHDDDVDMDPNAFVRRDRCTIFFGCVSSLVEHTASRLLIAQHIFAKRLVDGVVLTAGCIDADVAAVVDVLARLCDDANPSAARLRVAWPSVDPTVVRATLPRSLAIHAAATAATWVATPQQRAGGPVAASPAREALMDAFAADLLLAMGPLTEPSLRGWDAVVTKAAVYTRDGERAAASPIRLTFPPQSSSLAAPCSVRALPADITTPSATSMSDALDRAPAALCGAATSTNAGADGPAAYALAPSAIVAVIGNLLIALGVPPTASIIAAAAARRATTVAFTVPCTPSPAAPTAATTTTSPATVQHAPAVVLPIYVPGFTDSALGCALAAASAASVPTPMAAHYATDLYAAVKDASAQAAGKEGGVTPPLFVHPAVGTARPAAAPTALVSDTGSGTMRTFNEALSSRGLTSLSDVALSLRRGFVLDVVADIRAVNGLAVWSNCSGMVTFGGGIVKHHICNANLFRNGAEYSVFVNTGQEFDGSDAGARPDEAMSWGKCRLGSHPVKVYSEATVALPAIVEGSFAKVSRRE